MTDSTKQAEVIVYSRNICPYCTRAKALLSSKGISITEINLDLSPEKIEDMLDKSGGQRSVPQIFINNEHIGGCDELFELQEKGELDSKLLI